VVSFWKEIQGLLFQDNSTAIFQKGTRWVPFGITSLLARGIRSRASHYFPKGTQIARGPFGGGANAAVV
jgi:hypothetical protein